jgi:hypothetical protein
VSRRLKLALALLGLAGLGLLFYLGPLRPGRKPPERPEAMPTRFEDFASDPGWQSHGNRRLGQCTTTSQDFGWRPSVAVGDSRGAVGGLVTRAVRPAQFGKRLQLTFDRPFNARGTLVVKGKRNEPFDSGSVMVGFFNHANQDWRPPNALVFEVDTDPPDGGDYALAVGWGSRDHHAGGKYVGGSREEAEGFDFGRVYRWRLRYDPSAGDHGKALLGIDGRRAVSVALTPEGRRAGASLDRFGIANQVKTRGAGVEMYVSDLRIDGTPQDPGSDPAWAGAGNQVAWQDCYTGDVNEFGWTGPADGSLGGFISRTDEERPGLKAFYADRVGVLALDDRLHAEGTVRLERANSDSATLLGWFRGGTTGAREAELAPPDFIGIAITGPSSVGQYFGPLVSDRRGELAPEDAEGIVLNPGPGTHRWSFDYYPDAGRDGEVVVRLDGRRVRLKLPGKLRDRGASFNRFGMRNVERGGSFQLVYFDDVRYTVSRGALPPKRSAARRARR